jgi:hypothetical protein
MSDYLEEALSQAGMMELFSEFLDSGWVSGEEASKIDDQWRLDG